MMDKKKLTPEQQFFNDITLEFAEELYNQNEEKLKEAYKGQKENRDNILIEIAKVLLSYKIADSILNITSKERTKIYLDLSNLINKNIKSELVSETKLTKNILTSIGKEKYNVNNYVYSLGADFKATQLSDEALDKIINTKVEDKLWSDRLYDNKNDMSKILRIEVKKFLNGETNVNEIEKVIKDKYNTNAYETKRLVQDNICRVQEGVNDQWQHDNGIKYVIYMATLDGHVCAKCAPYDSRVYELDKKPVFIPQHPFCRCVYISLVNKDWHPKMRLDNETKENINWQSYQEWVNGPGTEYVKMKRKSSNIGEFAKLEEPMQLKYVKNVCKEAKIDLEGIKIKIQRDKTLIGLPFFASADPKDIGRIDLFPSAFKNRDELLRTIVHEKVHVGQYKKYSGQYVMENRNKFEEEAYKLEEKWYNEYKKKG